MILEEGMIGLICRRLSRTRKRQYRYQDKRLTLHYGESGSEELPAGCPSGAYKTTAVCSHMIPSCTGQQVCSRRKLHGRTIDSDGVY
jgi:hypothetical protein